MPRAGTKPSYMLIHAQMDDQGGLVLRVRSDKARNKIIAHLKLHGVESNGTVYLQSQEDIEDFFVSYSISKYKARDIRDGCRTGVRINDIWTFLHYFGYDTHVLNELGEI